MVRFEPRSRERKYIWFSSWSAGKHCTSQRHGCHRLPPNKRSRTVSCRRIGSIATLYRGKKTFSSDWVMKTNPSSLFDICCDCFLPVLEKIEKTTREIILKNLGGFVVEELLSKAIEIENKFSNTFETWKSDWIIFLTKNIKRASIPWRLDVIQHLKSENLRLVRVVICDNFNVLLFEEIPKSVNFVLFDLERVMAEGGRRSWLPEAEEILKSLCVSISKLPEPNSSANLIQVDLGSVPATSSDLQVIIQNNPNLRHLHHYQMAKALYDLNVEAWKKGEKLPIYKLKNLDIDFSHVVRCRMSPEWVLAPDALQLATILCPQAVTIRLRFDCSTPNDVLTPLLNLDKIRQFSAVCVSSGERTNLDFSDLTPIFEKYGPTSLAFLELKVIEEVEIHIIIEFCTRLETLILSGCGYVTPPTCPSYECQAFKPGTFTKLKHLFFADGDDFSWDHGAPECFWRASLLPSAHRPKMPLEGLFLEFPRIPDPLTAQVFQRTSEQLPFPQLKVASLCRYNELTFQDIVSMAGLEKNDNPPLEFLRISDCEKFEPEKEKSLRNWFKQRGITSEIFVDGDPQNESEQRRPLTFKIFRPR